MSQTDYESSVTGADEAECGCNFPTFSQESQGIVPEPGAVMQPITSTTLTVGSDVRPTKVTFDFGPGINQIPTSGDPGPSQVLPEPAPGPLPADGLNPPNAVVKIYDGQTVVKVPDSDVKVSVDGDGGVAVGKMDCSFNDDGHCPACGV